MLLGFTAEETAALSMLGRERASGDNDRVVRAELISGILVGVPVVLPVPTINEIAKLILACDR